MNTELEDLVYAFHGSTYFHAYSFQVLPDMFYLQTANLLEHLDPWPVHLCMSSSGSYCSAVKNALPWNSLVESHHSSTLTLYQPELSNKFLCTSIWMCSIISTQRSPCFGSFTITRCKKIVRNSLRSILRCIPLPCLIQGNGNLRHFNRAAPVQGIMSGWTFMHLNGRRCWTAP